MSEKGFNRGRSGCKRQKFICTDDDFNNLTTAMLLSQNTNVMNVYVRMTHWPLSGISENPGEEFGVIFVNINSLVSKGIVELPGIFEPAQESDLRRSKLTCSSTKH